MKKVFLSLCPWVLGRICAVPAFTWGLMGTKCSQWYGLPCCWAQCSGLQRRGLEEPEGRARSPPWAGATCRWRGMGSWELISWLWAASSIIQLADGRGWWWGCRKDLPLLRHANWRGSLEFQPGARLAAQPKAGANFASKIHRRLRPWKCRIALGKEDKSQRTKTDLFFLPRVSEDGEGQDKKAVTCWGVSAMAGDRRLVLPGVQNFVAS